MGKKLFIVGVGPGSSKYITDIAKEKIKLSKFIVGYKYTLKTINELIDKNVQNVQNVTMNNQDSIYLQIYEKMNEGEYCTVPFTGDANFSESEVVDRLLEIFGDDNVEIIPGISAIQVAASKSKIPLDKSHITTFHITGNIEQKKSELVEKILSGSNIILLPRPWPSVPDKNFMQSEIAKYLKKNGINTKKINVWVFEYLTDNNKETIFYGKISDLEDKKFSDLSVMVIDQNKRQTYLEID